MTKIQEINARDTSKVSGGVEGTTLVRIGGRWYDTSGGMLRPVDIAPIDIVIP